MDLIIIEEIYLGKMKITEKELRYMVNECVKHILSEDSRPIHFKHEVDGETFNDYDGEEEIGNEESEMDDEAKERQYRIDNCDYDAFIVVNDSDGAIVADYTVDGNDDGGEVYDEAMEDAKRRSLDNTYGTYSVFGCIGNQYDDDTLVDTFRMGKRI